MSHPFVVIEGIDGVGKTTVAQLLATQIGAIQVATPQAPFSERASKNPICANV